ncbi:MAG: PKD domain-containing protein [Bacteroidetes bacterium]|nr:PKD domain-containing protein [Bacteroidota bacterium]
MKHPVYLRTDAGRKRPQAIYIFLLPLLGIIFFILPLTSLAQQQKDKYNLGQQLVPNNYNPQRSSQGGSIMPMYDPMTGNLNTSCPNSNFSQGDWTGWTGCYGYGQSAPVPSCQNVGMLTGPPYPACPPPGGLNCYTAPLHKIMAGPGYMDSFGCDTVVTVFPGESFSARLGDTTTGRHGAELHYEVYVTSTNYLFVYRYAIVLEEPVPAHSVAQQPNFQVVLRDSVGNTLDPVCGYYYISAPTSSNTPPPGWKWCTSGGRPRYARAWTTVGMDLTPYVGRHITLAFIAKGCGVVGGSHRGYAYVSAYCSSLIIQTSLCQGDTTATLTAPPGFAHYLWSTGDTTESITVPHPVTGTSYSVLLTAFNNCTVTLTMPLTYTVIDANFNVIPNCPTYLTQFHDISTLNQNFVVLWDWDWGDGSGVTTTNNPNPTHVFMTPGTFSVKMVAHSTEGCKDSITKSVTIDTLALVTNNPMSKTICSGDHINLTITSNVTGAGFTWTATPQHPATTSGYHNNAVLKTFLNDTLLNIGLIPDTVRYALRPHDNTCIGPDTTYKVVVLPKPGLTNVNLSQSVCSNAPTTAVTLVPRPSPPAIVTFNWTAYPSSPLLTGYIPSATGSLSIPVQTIINNTGVPQYIDDSITPYLQAASACPGDKKAYRFIINPLPIPAVTGLTSVCANTNGVIYSTPNVAGHDYVWTVTGAISFTGNHTNSISVNWGAGPTGTVQVQEIDQNQSTNCSVTTPVTSVALNANPTPVISGVQNPCGLSIQPYTLGSPLPGHSYVWTVNGGAPVSGNNSSITVTWGNTNPIGIDVTETISYPAGVNCTAQAPLYPLTLITFPLPAGSITGTNAVCNTWTRTYSVPPITNADSYTWWYTPATGVTITNNGPSANLAFDLTANSGNLFVKGNKTGCGSGPTSPAYSITVNPLPYISLASCNDPKTSTTSRPFYLKGGVPPGGQYYIDGNLVTGGLITPSSLTTTTHQITYRYTDMNTCASTSPFVTLIVLPGSLLSTCPYTFTDSRNSKVYHASLMGGRCWMLENLNYGSKLDPDIQPQTDNCVVEKYCSSADINCTVYGGLYQWDEMMQYRIPGPGEYLQGLCPPEWHVPTATEWQMLIDGQTNAGNGIAGGDLKDPNPGLGFKAVLLGIYYQNNVWAFTSGNLKATIFWTSTSGSSTRALTRGMNSYNESISVYYSVRSNALPVRCVKDF